MFTILLSLFACADALEGDPVAGETVYADSCAGCHGADGEGASGPAMTEKAPEMSAERIAEIALDGDGEMAATDVTEQEAADVGAYVSEQWGG